MVQRGENSSYHRNFAYCYRPIYYFARVAGQMPFTITSRANAAIVGVKLYKRDFIWSAISLSIQISFIWMAINFYRSVLIGSAFTSTIYFGNLTIWFLSLLLGISVMALDACNRLKFIRILNKITVFDIEMIRFGVYFDYQMGNRHAWLYCGAIVLFASVILAISFHTYAYFLKSYTAFNVIEYVGTGLHQNQMMGGPILTYIYLLRNIQKRYAALNRLLRKRIFDGNKLTIDAGKVYNIETIKFIGQHHGRLTSIIDLLNICCSFQIMVLAAFTFAVSVLSFYSFYRFIVQQNDEFEHFAWDHVQMLSYYLTLILIVIHNANRVFKEGKKTAHIAYDKINNCTDSDVSFSLTQLTLQVENRHPLATCGLFPFNWALLLTMAGSATIYLTILLNFGSQPDASRNQTCQCTM